MVDPAQYKLLSTESSDCDAITRSDEHFNPEKRSPVNFLSVLTLFFFVTVFGVGFYAYITEFNYGQLKMAKIEVIELRNIENDSEKLLKAESRQIFFIESHLESNRKFEKARQACSVEAAARINPDLPVYLLFATESDLKLNRSRYTDILASYDNIHIRKFNIYDYSKGTTLEPFISSKVWQKSDFKLEHMSDIMRLLTLNKFGGLYMDLDVLMLQPFRYIDESNFFCIENPKGLANCIFHLDQKEGKEFSEKCLNEIKDNYQPNEWSSNGPELLTRISKNFCPDIKFSMKDTTMCGNFTILKSNLCFPISPGGYKNFYKAKNPQKVIDSMKNSYFVHIWNKMQDFGGERFDRIELDSWAPYLQMARTYCPKVHDSLDEYFRKK